MKHFCAQLFPITRKGWLLKGDCSQRSGKHTWIWPGFTTWLVHEHQGRENSWWFLKYVYTFFLPEMHSWKTYWIVRMQRMAFYVPLFCYRQFQSLALGFSTLSSRFKKQRRWFLYFLFENVPPGVFNKIKWSESQCTKKKKVNVLKTVTEFCLASDSPICRSPTSNGPFYMFETAVLHKSAFK